jgi:hypothetical protein
MVLTENAKQQLKIEFENLANKLFDENQKIKVSLYKILFLY